MFMTLSEKRPKGRKGGGIGLARRRDWGSTLFQCAFLIRMVRSSFIAKDGTEVIIREPVKTDAALLMRLVNAVIDEPMSGLLINKKIGLEYERKWLKGRLDEIRSKKIVQLVAEVDSKIVGSCSVDRRRYKESHRAELGIAISKDYRGKGIGEALMRMSIRLAKQRMKGLEQIDLQTFSYNKRSQNLYKKVGFVRTGYVPRAIKEGNEYYGEHVMVLLL
jgi:RimJ/RimL family protein N-acetyltransferase